MTGRFSRIAVGLLAAACLAVAGFAPDAGEAQAKKARAKTSTSIEWGERIDLIPPEGGMGRYPRLVKITRGDRAGDLLLCYQTGRLGGDFWTYRSVDGGLTWEDPTMVNASTPKWAFASCNIVQLDDGRLLMSMLRHAKTGGSNLAQDYFIDVRYSHDGGQTWGKPEQIFQGANWEARAIQVPNDSNSDGHDDIYMFFTQRAVPTHVPASKATRNDDYGRSVAWIASYDNGKTWVNPNPERFTGRIVHRNYAERGRQPVTDDSGGGMPQPFLLANDRIGFVAEEVGKQPSPMLVATDPGDWDWEAPAFQGPWTSADYDGTDDNNAYPLDPDNAWAVTPGVYGLAPYGSTLADGRIVVSQNVRKVTEVYLGDENGQGFVQQESPFGDDVAVFSFVEPISEDEIIVGGGPPEEGGAFIYLRRGRIVD